jgi:hypothetical protein
MVKDYSFGTERSTRIKDYHLKACMVGQKCKNKEGVLGKGGKDNTYYPSIARCCWS